jgi:hypothetical protein
MQVEQICNLIQEEGIKKLFMVALRLEIGERLDILTMMYDTGFRVLSFGIEDEVIKEKKN